MTTSQNRLAFLVDAFNLYHSLVEAAKEIRASTRWLDVHALCESYLSVVGTYGVSQSVCGGVSCGGSLS